MKISVIQGKITSYCDTNDLLLPVVSTKPQAAAVNPLTPSALRDKSKSRSDTTEAWNDLCSLNPVYSTYSLVSLAGSAAFTLILTKDKRCNMLKICRNILLCDVHHKGILGGLRRCVFFSHLFAWAFQHLLIKFNLKSRYDYRKISQKWLWGITVNTSLSVEV